MSSMPAINASNQSLVWFDWLTQMLNVMWVMAVYHVLCSVQGGGGGGGRGDKGSPCEDSHVVITLGPASPSLCYLSLTLCLPLISTSPSPLLHLTSVCLSSCCVVGTSSVVWSRSCCTSTSAGPCVGSEPSDSF